jgi:6-phosphogluconolactonase
MRRSTYPTLLALIFSAVCTVGLATGMAQSSSPAGAVYALTNSPAANAVLVYDRDEDGSLSPAESFATGGTGSGSQGAVIVTDDRRFLFAVNAGSNSISSFRIERDGLELVDHESSGGVMPTSVAYHHGLLYVLNAGVPNSVVGFHVGPRGELTAIEGSRRALSAASTSPAQVDFDHHGQVLVVTERSTNLIDTFLVDDDGRLDGPFSHVSAGPVPFGFAVTSQNALVVSEAGDGGGASTYGIGRDAVLHPVSSMIMTGQRAACWAVVTKNGQYGYVTNAGTGNISGFSIARDGSAALLDADGVTAITGGNPTDAALSDDSRFLYARIAALNAIAIFQIGRDGSLIPLPSLTGTPGGLAGLAAF